MELSGSEAAGAAAEWYGSFAYPLQAGAACRVPEKAMETAAPVSNAVCRERRLVMNPPEIILLRSSTLSAPKSTRPRKADASNQAHGSAVGFLGFSVVFERLRISNPLQMPGEFD